MHKQATTLNASSPGKTQSIKFDVPVRASAWPNFVPASKIFPKKKCLSSIWSNEGIISLQFCLSSSLAALLNINKNPEKSVQNQRQIGRNLSSWIYLRDDNNKQGGNKNSRWNYFSREAHIFLALRKNNKRHEQVFAWLLRPKEANNFLMWFKNHIAVISAVSRK